MGWHHVTKNSPFNHPGRVLNFIEVFIDDQLLHLTELTFLYLYNVLDKVYTKILYGISDCDDKLMLNPMYISYGVTN